MAVTPIGTGTTATGSGATIDIDVPDSVQEGDLLVVVGRLIDTTQTGWTLLSSGAGTTHVFARYAGASEPSAYTLGSAASGDKVVAMAAYRNVITMPTVIAEDDDFSGTTATAPSVTTTGAEARVVVFYRAPAFSGTPAGLTLRADAGPSGGSAVRIYDFEQATAGATSTYDQTITSGVWVAGQLVMESGTTPNAPSLTAPTVGATVDVNDDIDLEGTFSDPDAGDQLSSVEVEYRLQTGIGLVQPGEQPASGQTFVYTIPGGTIAAGEWEWRARTRDQAGTMGAWSGWSQFVGQVAPAAPVITAPGATIAVNPSLTEWTAPVQDAYHVETRTGPGGTGVLQHGTTEYTDTRSHSTPRATNNQTEYTRVRVKTGMTPGETWTGLWSPWAEVESFVTFNPPTGAIPAVLADIPPSAITVSWEFLEPGEDDATPVAIRIYRRTRHPVTDVPGDATLRATFVPGDAEWDAQEWTDWRVGHRANVDYQLVTVGANGGTTSSAWAESDGLITALIEPTV